MEEKETIHQHESYGMLRFNRITNGGDTVLFGSSIPHQNTIRLSIGPGIMRRSLSKDWYYKEGRDYIDVEMSQAQFAEAISSMNMGGGVPVTIRRIHGKGVPEPDFQNKRLIFEQEFEDRMVQLEKSLRHLTENAEDILKNKKSINKGDRDTILTELQQLRMEIAMNIPFMSKSYNEQMDITTQEAKAEVEAFTINKINQLGIQKWQEIEGLPNPANSKSLQIPDKEDI